jgi:3''-phosphoadenosine 5''-phosphosulfate sulfotransferase (PAPS reductase)/FAD synthetase and related enzymes
VNLEEKNKTSAYEGSSLVEHTLFGTEDYVQRAIKEIRAMAGQKHICLRFSGGKDSVVIKRLLDMAGVPYTARFSKTSVDPPELLEFIKREHKDVIVEYPRISMFQLIIKKGFPPTRICRYCCQEFKERNVCGRDDGIITVTGVRKAESPRRKSRSKYERCQADKGVYFFHPIVNWSDEQVWDFIRAEGVPYCRLYDEGLTRIGCVGCPLASSEKIVAEFKRWPQFEKAYLWAFERMLEGRSFDKWKTKYDVMDWYIYGAEKDCAALADGRQISLFSEDYFDQFDAGEDAYPFSADDARRIILGEFARAPLGKGV